MLPAATEIVYALGLDDHLIGVTYECDEPPAARTKRVVTRSALAADLSPAEIDRQVRERSSRGEPLTVLDVDYLRDVPADVILTQDLCQVCAVPAGDVSAALDRLGCSADVVSLDPHTIDDIFTTILEVGRHAGVPGRAEELVGRLRDRIAAVERSVAGRAPVPTLALEWIDPPFVAGHWLPEMIERAGARVIAVDAAGYFVRPGPRVVDGIEALAAALHPDVGLPDRPAVAAELDRG